MFGIRRYSIKWIVVCTTCLFSSLILRVIWQSPSIIFVSILVDISQFYSFSFKYWGDGLNHQFSPGQLYFLLTDTFLSLYQCLWAVLPQLPLLHCLGCRYYISFVLRVCRIFTGTVQQGAAHLPWSSFNDRFSGHMALSKYKVWKVSFHRMPLYYNIFYSMENKLVSFYFSQSKRRRNCEQTGKSYSWNPT